MRLQQRRPRTAGISWHWAWSADDPLRLPIWIILADAVGLLTGADQADQADLANLRLCAGKLRLAVHRHQQEPQQALVQHERLR